MANVKISGLPTASTPLTGAELVPVVQSGVTSQTTVSDFGAAVSYTPSGTGAVATTVQAKLRETVSVKDFGAVGDGVTDDTAAIQAAIDSLTDGSKLYFPSATNYVITDTLEFFNKPRVVIDFNQQFINASGFTGSARPALHFKGIAQSIIGDVMVVGNKTSVSHGVFFDADVPPYNTIHAEIGKIYVNNCDCGIQVGSDNGAQFDDCTVIDLYASECNTGIRITGENTLAMLFLRVAAYLSTNRGVHIEQGSGQISSLQVGYSSGYDIYFGSTTGFNGNKLNRWDIQGYSELGAVGEKWIGSAPCNDTNPFREQITIKHFRATPFSNNSQNFIEWRLNGDLILENITVNHGQQEPLISVDYNTSYYAPNVILSESVIDCSPTTATQVPLSYDLSDKRQCVEINSRVNNGISFWQNAGSANDGVIKRGIYMGKIKQFEQSLLSISGLLGAWNLRDATSDSCTNLVLGKPSLSASATLQRRDFWLDDGLVGFYRNTTTSKTLSTNSSTYAAASEYTFGAILRATTSGTTEENYTNIGGTLGMRIALYPSALLCLVGGVNAFNGAVNCYDPHLVIGRYISGTSVKVNAINLRTGDTYSATNTTSIPAYGTLTWSNGVNLRNDVCVRGFPFVYNRALTDLEVNQLLQEATLLTNSWQQ